MQQALVALDECAAYVGSPSWSPSMEFECKAAAKALRAALEEPINDETEAFWRTMGGQLIAVIASIWQAHPDYSIRQTLDELNRVFHAPQPKTSTWTCTCGADLFINKDGEPASKAKPQPELVPTPTGWQLVPMEPTWEMTRAGIAPLSKPDPRVADIALAYCAMLKAAPHPQRAPLTDEQIDGFIAQIVDPVATYKRLLNFARAIERAHGIWVGRG
jgi:hypothetical protein